MTFITGQTCFSAEFVVDGMWQWNDVKKKLVIIEIIDSQSGILSGAKIQRAWVHNTKLIFGIIHSRLWLYLTCLFPLLIRIVKWGVDTHIWDGGMGTNPLPRCFRLEVTSRFAANIMALSAQTIRMLKKLTLYYSLYLLDSTYTWSVWLAILLMWHELSMIAFTSILHQFLPANIFPRMSFSQWFNSWL